MIDVKHTYILILFLLMSACGYHLRGSINLPEGLQKVYLQGGSAQLRNSMSSTLKSSGGKLVGNIQEAAVVIKVVKEKMRRNVLSLSSTGRANEYELNYFLDYILLNLKGKPLTKTQTIEINRDYFNDQEDILGKNNEELVIREEIYNQAVYSLVNRTRIVLEKSEKKLKK